LWATFPASGESLALTQLLIIQLIASSLLFPFLCKIRQSTIAILLASFPALALAGYLSQAGSASVLAAAVFLTLWLIGLAGWREVVKTERSQLIAICIASSLTVGGTAVVYLARESVTDVSRLSRASLILEGTRVTNQPDFQAFFVVLSIAIS